MKSSKKQVLNSDKNTEIESFGCYSMFVACSDGSVQEFSMISETIVYDHDQILDHLITSMAKTLDNK